MKLAPLIPRSGAVANGTPTIAAGHADVHSAARAYLKRARRSGRNLRVNAGAVPRLWRQFWQRRGGRECPDADLAASFAPPSCLNGVPCARDCLFAADSGNRAEAR